MAKMRHVQCKMLSLRKTRCLNTPCSTCAHLKNPIKRVWQMFCPNTIQFEPVDSNRSFLLFIFINRLEMYMKRIYSFYIRNTCIVYLQYCVYSYENHKKVVLLTDSDLLLFTWFKWWRHLWRLQFKYSSGLCKMRFYQYHLFSFQITSIYHLKTNISLIRAHR